MQDIFTSKLSTILTKGTGAKIALFDVHTKPILSSHVTHTTFLQNDFFLFQMLADTRCPMHGLTCVIFAQPASIYQIVCELKVPKYGRYIVCFTTGVSDDILEMMARSDRHGMVSEVYEMNIDVVRYDDMLYRIDTDNRVDGMLSVLSTTGMCPKIVADTRMKGLADELQARMPAMSRQKRAGTLIMLDRSFDPFTPLVHEWRYQAMIYEYLRSCNGVVVLDKTYVLNDTFYHTNKFMDINTISSNLREFIRTADTGTIDLTALAETARTKETLEKHLRIHNHIVKHCVDNKEISETEMRIIKENMGSRQLERVLGSGRLSRDQRNKLVLIYLLRNPDKMGREIFQSYTGVHRLVRKYAHAGMRVPSFKERVDIKLGYTPVITRVLDRVLRNRIDGHLSTDSSKTTRPYVVYINDITLNEYRAICMFFRERNILDYMVVCDRVINYTDILNDIG